MSQVEQAPESHSTHKILESKRLTLEVLRQQLNEILSSLDHEMVPATAITIDMFSELLGRESNFGMVRAGQLEGRAEMVAVKEIRLKGSAKARAPAEIAFARELKVWESLDHPNIVPLLAFHMNSHEVTIQTVTPLAEGGNVTAYLAGAKPNMRTRLQLALDTANGILYLHEKGLCHSRLRGENVLIFNISGLPSAKLSDFGLNRVEFEGTSTHVKVTNHGRGFQSYLCPELVTNKYPKQDLKTDIWAWGCILLEIISDRRPYADATRDHQIPLRILQGELPADEAHMPEDEGVRRILSECWEKEPQNRPTILVCRDQLAAFIR